MSDLHTMPALLLAALTVLMVAAVCWHATRVACHRGGHRA